MLQPELPVARFGQVLSVNIDPLTGRVLQLVPTVTVTFKTINYKQPSQQRGVKKPSAKQSQATAMTVTTKTAAHNFVAACRALPVSLLPSGPGLLLNGNFHPLAVSVEREWLSRGLLLSVTTGRDHVVYCWQNCDWKLETFKEPSTIQIRVCTLRCALARARADSPCQHCQVRTVTGHCE